VHVHLQEMKMRQLITIIFYFTLLCNFQHCFGQGICTIKYSIGFSGLTIKLLDSNKFEYLRWTDIDWHNWEYGMYSFDNKELNLKFVDTTKPQKESEIVSMESIPNNLNKTKIKIISEMYNQPLEFATIQIYSNDKLIADGKADSSGEALLIFENTNHETRIKTSYVLHQNFDLILNLENRDYDITINLCERTKRTNAHKDGELVTYIIARETKEYIELSEDGKEFRSYKIACQ